MVYSTNQFQFQKKGRVLVGELSELGIPPGEGFPNTVTVKSAHTGKIATFVKDHAAAQRNEWWDGEMYEYKSQDTEVGLVLIND